MCVRVDIWGWTLGHVYRCARRDQRKTLQQVLFLRRCPPFFLDRVSHEVCQELGWLTRKPLGSSCPHLSSTGVTSMHHYTWLLHMVPGEQTQFLTFAWQVPGVSTWILETGSHCIAQVDFELMTLLLPTPVFYEYRSELPCLSSDPNRGL